MNFYLKRTITPIIFFTLVFVFVAKGILFAQSERASKPEIKIFRIGGDTLISQGVVNTSRFYHPVFSYRSRDLYFEIDTAYQPSGVVYHYFLDGLKGERQTLTKYPLKEYTNLDPGHYVFRVSRGGEMQHREILEYSFRILPPYYSSIAAYVIYTIFLILLLWTIIKSRNYQFAKQRYQLEKLINARTYELLKEKDRTEDLLANVLPKGTADEIMSTGRAKKKKYAMVTVLFSDIQGFTKIAESMNPEVLIDELDKFFFHFDSVAEKYNIEKIKTIGDAYMCAGGIPEKNRTNPVEVVLAALEMQQYMNRLKKELADNHHQVWDVRIGIHTGPVVAGVVGHKKLSYDIWGDTVNTASRMESSGEPGKINISGSTYELVKDFFICEYRGRMPVKYKGEIDMYFVTGIRPELSDGDLTQPGEAFILKLQLLRLQDLEEYVVEKIEAELAPHFTFHDARHTIQVATMAELIGRAEQVNDKEMLLLRTAALIHDLGYLSMAEDHIEAGCDHAVELLPKFNYDPHQIEVICRLIRSIRDPLVVTGTLEQILCDANLNFLGRIDFKDVIERMWKEDHILHPEMTLSEWKKRMASLVKKYDFYTDTAKRLRDVHKEKQLEILDELNLEK